MKHKNRSGQSMLIAILTLGGAIFGATTLAGLLLLYQIRATGDSENSAMAIFAADSGINWALYSYFNPPPEGPQPVFNTGVSVIVTCYDANNSTTACDNSGATTSSYAISEGLSGGSRRAFLLNLTGATTTLP